MKIHVLGPLRVWDGTAIDLDRRSHRRLLSILILEMERPIRIEALIDRFWAGGPPATARAAIHTHMSALRRILGSDTIATKDDTYQLSIDVFDVDSSEFQRIGDLPGEAALRRDWDSALSAAHDALALWQGGPFVELADDLFARPTIVKLEELHLEIRQTRAEALLGLNRPAEVLADLEGLVIEFPLRERLWEHLMTARYRLGRPTDALRAYQDVGRHLAEIGLEPGERLRRLEERILLQDRTLMRTQHNLPAELSSFVGRAEEILESTGLIANNRLTTVTGAGGSGKTRLANQIARGLLDEYPDGVWLIELASTQNPDQVSIETARAMGLTPKGEDVLDVITAATAGTKTLIILDSCEHVLGGAAITAHRLLESSSELRILATSREPLRVAGESVYEISGLGFPGDHRLDLHKAMEYEAICLFEDRAKQGSSFFEVDESNLDDASTICRRLDGMPLAIELAAARVRSLTVKGVANRLDDHLQLLTGGLSTAPPRQQTLQATIEWSYRLLDHMERAVLNRLSVFSGGFELEAAEQVVSGAGIVEGRITAAVAGLVDKSLITVYETGHGVRYRLLETVRQYAAQRFRETTHTTTIRDRHLGWSLSLVHDLWARAMGGGQIALARDLESEIDNLRTALEWAISSDDSEATVSLHEALGWHWYFTGHLSNAASVLRAGSQVTNNERQEALTRALLARCLAYSEEVPAAITEAESAHRLIGSLRTPLERTWVIATVQLSRFMSVESDPRSMLPLATEAERVALDQGDDFAEILARQLMADAYCWNGRTAEGLEQQQVARGLAAASGDATMINHIYGLSIYNYMLDPTARRTEPLRVTEEWMSLGTVSAETWTSIATDWLPWVYMQVGDFERASEAIARIENRTLEGYNRTIYLMVRASLAWMMGDLRMAVQYIDDLQARDMSPRWAHTFYPLAADIAADLGRLDEVRVASTTYTAMTVHPTREASKLGVLNPLVRAEVDAAIDTGSRKHMERAHTALEQMHRILRDHPPLVASSTSVMTHIQNLAFAEAEMTRATESNPDRWIEAIAQSDYAYYRLYARWRLGEALLQAGEKSNGTTELEAVHEEIAGIGASSLQSRVEATARDFDLHLD